MGFFSWWTRGHKTKTTRPIYNKHLLKNLKKEGKDISGYCQKVWMHIPSLDGKTSTSHLEENYDGYGIFGGVDYYTALSKCNPVNDNESFTDEQHRSRGIDLFFGNESLNIQLLYPIITETETYNGSFFEPNQTCEGQGYWLEEDDKEDEESSDHSYWKRSRFDDEDDEVESTKKVKSK